MFNRTKCPRCNNKFSKKYSFCPHCGFSMRDGEKFFEPSFNLGFPFNTIFKQLEKQIEREMRNIDKNMDKSMLDMEDPNPLMGGLTIRIDSSGGTPIIKVSPMNGKPEKEKAPKESVGLRTKITEEKAEEISKLPKEEAKTTVRRLTDRIIYELDVPGVDKDNILVTKLQNSIEIKAFSKDKAYFKLIPVSHPILNSKLEEGKLVLELKL